MFSRSRGRHRHRSQRRSRSRLLPLVVAALALTSMTFVQSAYADTPTFTITTGYDGTGFGGGTQCTIGDTSASDGKVCTASYTATQADVNAGSITNTAIASGSDPAGTPVPTVRSTATSRASVTNGLTVTKTPSPSQISKFDDVVTFAVDVTNTGNQSVHGLAVTDVVDSWATGTIGAITCDTTSLNPQQTAHCSFTYTASQADVDHGGTLSDTVTAKAKDPQDNDLSASAPASVTVNGTAAITLTKTADKHDVKTVGDVITYTFVFTNTGTQTLFDTQLTDAPLAPAGAVTIDCGPITLPTTVAPGASVQCTATYAVTQADLDAGSIQDTATVTGTPQTGGPVEASSSATVGVTSDNGLAIVKSAVLGKDAAGQQMIEYTFTVTNFGNQTLHHLRVFDHQEAPAGALTSGPTCPKQTLAPDEVMKCHGTYVITSSDIQHRTVTDTAYATGRTPSNDPVRSGKTTLTVTFYVKHGPGLAQTGVPVVAMVGTGLLMLLAGAGSLILGARRRRA